MVCLLYISNKKSGSRKRIGYAIWFTNVKLSTINLLHRYVYPFFKYGILFIDENWPNTFLKYYEYNPRYTSNGICHN